MLVLLLGLAESFNASHAREQGYGLSHSIEMRSVNGTSHKLKWVVAVVVAVSVDVYVAALVNWPRVKRCCRQPAGFFFRGS